MDELSKCHAIWWLVRSDAKMEGSNFYEKTAKSLIECNPNAYCKSCIIFCKEDYRGVHEDKEVRKHFHHQTTFGYWLMSKNWAA
jgi:hypothetical protein